MSRNRLRKGESGPFQEKRSFTWAAGAIAANTTTSQNFAFPGAEVGDLPVVANNPTANGLQFSGQRVVIAGTVTIIAQNSTGGGLDPGALPIVVALM